jgi:hypothetical protein
MSHMRGFCGRIFRSAWLSARARRSIGRDRVPIRSSEARAGLPERSPKRCPSRSSDIWVSRLPFEDLLMDSHRCNALPRRAPFKRALFDYCGALCFEPIIIYLPNAANGRFLHLRTARVQR